MTKILLLEDELVFADLIKSGLEGVGYEITHCTSGSEALETLTKQKFDILIVDILIKNGVGLLPDGGISVITTIRTALPTMTELGYQSKLPILAISGSVPMMDGPDLLDIAKEMGANATLRKPFAQPKLLEAIRQITENTA